MSTTLTLIIAMFRMFVRDRQALFFTFFMPFIIMAIFGLIGFDQLAKVELGVVKNQPTEATAQFIDSLAEIEVFSINEGTEEGERAALEAGERSIVIIIPDDLIPVPGQPHETAALKLLVNQAKPQETQTGLGLLGQVLDKTTIALSGARPFYELATEEVNARRLRYIDFLIPGIIALSIMQLSVFGVAFFFTELKEKGVLKRLLATPMRPEQFVVANVVNRLLLTLGQVAVLLAVSILLFDFEVIGSYFLIALILMLGAVMFLSLGFSISGLAKTTESVPAIANLIIFPMLFLGGTFFPLSSMPDWLSHIVRYLPLTYLSESMRAVMNDGAGLADVWPSILWMLAWAAGLVILAVFTFRFEERKV